jgi:hypothetical protein
LKTGKPAETTVADKIKQKN